MKKELILLKSKTKIKPFSKYLIISVDGISTIISYKHINNIYINKTIDITLNELYKISKQFPTFIIDQNGYIIASIKEEK